MTSAISPIVQTGVNFAIPPTNLRPALPPRSLTKEQHDFLSVINKPYFFRYKGELHPFNFPEFLFEIDLRIRLENLSLQSDCRIPDLRLIGGLATQTALNQFEQNGKDIDFWTYIVWNPGQGGTPDFKSICGAALAKVIGVAAQDDRWLKEKENKVLDELGSDGKSIYYKIRVEDQKGENLWFDLKIDLLGDQDEKAVHCVNSANSIQVRGFFEHYKNPRNPLYFDVAPGYDFDRSLELRSKGWYEINPEMALQLKHGLKANGVTHVKGVAPHKPEQVALLFDRYQSEYANIEEFFRGSKRHPSLLKYLRSHYSRIGGVFAYLTNLRFDFFSHLSEEERDGFLRRFDELSSELLQSFEKERIEDEKEESTGFDLSLLRVLSFWHYPKKESKHDRLLFATANGHLLMPPPWQETAVLLALSPATLKKKIDENQKALKLLGVPLKFNLLHGFYGNFYLARFKEMREDPRNRNQVHSFLASIPLDWLEKPRFPLECWRCLQACSNRPVGPLPTLQKEILKVVLKPHSEETLLDLVFEIGRNYPQPVRDSILDDLVAFGKFLRTQELYERLEGNLLLILSAFKPEQVLHRLLEPDLVHLKEELLPHLVFVPGASYEEGDLEKLLSEKGAVPFPFLQRRLEILFSKKQFRVAHKLLISLLKRGAPVSDSIKQGVLELFQSGLSLTLFELDELDPFSDALGGIQEAIFEAKKRYASSQPEDLCVLPPLLLLEGVKAALDRPNSEYLKRVLPTALRRLAQEGLITDAIRKEVATILQPPSEFTLQFLHELSESRSAPDELIWKAAIRSNRVSNGLLDLALKLETRFPDYWIRAVTEREWDLESLRKIGSMIGMERVWSGLSKNRSAMKDLPSLISLCEEGPGWNSQCIAFWSKALVDGPIELLFTLYRFPDLQIFVKEELRKKIRSGPLSFSSFERILNEKLLSVEEVWTLLPVQKKGDLNFLFDLTVLSLKGRETPLIQMEEYWKQALPPDSEPNEVVLYLFGLKPFSKDFETYLLPLLRSAAVKSGRALDSFFDGKISLDDGGVLDFVMKAIKAQRGEEAIDFLFSRLGDEKLALIPGDQFAILLQDLDQPLKRSYKEKLERLQDLVPENQIISLCMEWSHQNKLKRVFDFLRSRPQIWGESPRLFDFILKWVSLAADSGELRSGIEFLIEYATAMEKHKEISTELIARLWVYLTAMPSLDLSRVFASWIPLDQVAPVVYKLFMQKQKLKAFDFLNARVDFWDDRNMSSEPSIARLYIEINQAQSELEPEVRKKWIQLKASKESRLDPEEICKLCSMYAKLGIPVAALRLLVRSQSYLDQMDSLHLWRAVSCATLALEDPLYQHWETLRHYCQLRLVKEGQIANVKTLIHMLNFEKDEDQIILIRAQLNEMLSHCDDPLNEMWQATFKPILENPTYKWEKGKDVIAKWMMFKLGELNFELNEMKNGLEYWTIFDELLILIPHNFEMNKSNQILIGRLIAHEMSNEPISYAEKILEVWKKQTVRVLDLPSDSDQGKASLLLNLNQASHDLIRLNQIPDWTLLDQLHQQMPNYITPFSDFMISLLKQLKRSDLSPEMRARLEAYFERCCMDNLRSPRKCHEALLKLRVFTTAINSISLTSGFNIYAALMLMINDLISPAIYGPAVSPDDLNLFRDKVLTVHDYFFECASFFIEHEQVNKETFIGILNMQVGWLTALYSIGSPEQKQASLKGIHQMVDLSEKIGMSLAQMFFIL